ncbi:extracellular solute-binding protein [Cohnella sp. GCM10012308]|uniref:extracellular solute-binding protein n=1 Tax=Cohnella sp. GCM10012308 TaxID=3317329 RepID=UPI00360D02B4
MKRRTAKVGLMSVLAGAMVLVSACSGTNKEESGQTAGSTAESTASASGTSTSSASGAEKADPFGKIDPPVELTAVRSIDPTVKYENGDTIEQNAWTKLYEQEFGIKLKYMWVTDPSQYAQKFNVTMASGKLPDIMPVSGIQLQQLVDAGQLEDLTQPLEQYGSDRTKELLAKDGGVGLDSATFGGKLLALPVNPGSTDSATLLWVRTDWLKKLNLPEPKTTEDIYKIAQAFVNDDPDGNGKKDTYGLGLSKEFYGGIPELGSGMSAVEGFFNAYHAYPHIWVKDASGELVYGSIQPEVKTALAELQKMYKEGLIDREFGVKDSEKLIQAVNSGKLGLFYGPMWVPLVFGEGRKLDPNMDWKPLPLPSVDSEPSKPQTVFNITQYYAVRKGSEHPEAVVKMLNAFHNSWDPAKYPATEISQNGDVQKWAYALVTGANPTQNLDAYKRVKEAIEKQDESLLDPKAPGQPVIYKAINDFKAGDQSGWGYTRVFDVGGAQEIINQYNENDGLKLTEFIASPTEAMVEKQPTLQKLELETFTKIVMGGASVDSFDDFVANWKKLGGDAITAEVAKWAASK